MVGLDWTFQLFLFYPSAMAGTPSTRPAFCSLALGTARIQGQPQLLWAPVLGPAHPAREQFLPKIPSNPALLSTLSSLTPPCPGMDPGCRTAPLSFPGSGHSRAALWHTGHGREWQTPRFSLASSSQCSDEGHAQQPEVLMGLSREKPPDVLTVTLKQFLFSWEGAMCGKTSWNDGEMLSVLQTEAVHLPLPYC